MLVPRIRPTLILLVLLLCGLVAANPTKAQFPSFGGDSFGGSFAGGAQAEPVTIAAQFSAPEGDEPGYLLITAEMEPPWYIYSITQPPGGPIATEITLEPSPKFELLAGFRATSPPKQKTEPEVYEDLVIETHAGTISWVAPLRLAAGADPTSLTISGQIRLQPCTPNNCLPPRPVAFSAALGSAADIRAAVAAAADVTPATAEVQPPQPPNATGDAQRSTDRSEAKPSSDDRLPWRPYTTFEAATKLLHPSFDPVEFKENANKQFDNASILWMVVLGFAGGIILNLMPCVLPVIGLKVLSFVEQAGHDRRRSLVLNIWYSLGLLSIFLVLATLAVALNLGWGHLFKSAQFNIVLASVVFAMGLSFLGIWEIPIPGFVGSGSVMTAAEKEGSAGAFAKGAITTILATPCTGPFMGSALAWAVQQPPWATYAVFGSVGLGMASPYLLIGAFPALVRFLPKPGAWMDTFKQIMGFVLLGTVVYLLTFLKWSYVVPTVALLFVVWAACWWIARVPVTADAGAKFRAWLQAVALIGAGAIILFPGLDEIVASRHAPSGLHDVMKSRFEENVERAAEFQRELMRQQGYELVRTDAASAPPTGPHTVLLDFTADWCLTCKTLEANFLNTPAVKELVEKNGVICLKADWTHEAPEVTRFMDLLGARQVPQVVIIPADNPNHPTGVFRDGYTEESILKALRAAGPSRGL